MKRLADIKGIGHIASLLAVIFFALNIPATSYILNGQVGVLGYVLLRTFGGAAVCWVLSMFIKHEPITSKKDKITIVLAGVIGLFVFFLSVCCWY